MQIAKIVPKVKTSGEGIFDYAILPDILPQIKLGVLVEVPFHGRKLEGIIVEIKKTSKIKKLKNIIRIIDPIPVIDENHLMLAKWMSDYYISSLGQTLFENIVPSAIRMIKKLDFISKYNNTFLARAQKVVRKHYLVHDDFSFRLKVYQKAIEQTLAKNKSVIILVPDISSIKYFNLNNPIILHANLTKTQRWLMWNKIRLDNNQMVVIGSQSALFAPVNNLGLIIVDQEENATYKNGRGPRFHVVDVAKKLTKISGANLILGSACPRIETYFNFVHNKYRILKREIQKKSEISIIDMNFQKSILSHPLYEAINDALRPKKRILLVLNRKGEGTKFACSDCGRISFREKQFPYPKYCPKCHSVKLKPFGVGIKRLANIISKEFPQAKIITIDKENPTHPHKNQWDIAIVTTFALKYNFPKIFIVGIIDADQGLNFPEYLASEKTFQYIFKFLKIGERGILQTHLPENPIIRFLAQLNYQKFYLDENKKRQKYQFPPFTRLIRLEFLSLDKVYARKESQKIFNQLTLLNEHGLEILGPSEPFINKILNKYRFQIIIKTKNFSNKLKLFLKTLNRDWIIDIDPMDLL